MKRLLFSDLPPDPPPKVGHALGIELQREKLRQEYELICHLDIVLGKNKWRFGIGRQRKAGKP